MEPEDNVEEEVLVTSDDSSDEFVVESGAETTDEPLEDSPAEANLSEDEEQPSEDVVEPSEEETEIDGVKYSKEDISKIFETGKRISEYQREHPGYDPILIHKDYTQKTQELADLKRKIPDEVRQQSAPAPATPDVDLSDVKKEDLEYFERIAKASGYVKLADLEQRDHANRVQTYEEVKRAEIKTFLEAHPEYRPENDPGDVKWTTLRQEFDLFKFPEDPHKIGTILERVHRSVAGTSSSFDPLKVAQIIAKKKSAATGQSSTGGSSGAQDAKPSNKTPQQKRVADLVKSGALKGFSAKELEDLLN